MDRGACDCLADRDAVRARLGAAVLAAAAADPASTPCAGDWVALRRLAEGRSVVEAVLPRRTAVVRAAVDPGSSRAQVLAANVDAVLVVEPLVPTPTSAGWSACWRSPGTAAPRRSWCSPSPTSPPTRPSLREEVAAGAPGAEVLTVSVTTGEGMDGVRALLAPGRTLAMVGASGAGKSSLTNALAGADVMAVNALRADGKGRHTTAHRELVALPGGGLLVDTPGLRSVGLAGPQGLEQVFADVDTLAAACRFGNCGHEVEPGCAVQAAVASGELAARRLASWHKLQREARYQAARTDARLRRAERDRWKTITRQMRRAGSHRR